MVHIDFSIIREMHRKPQQDNTGPLFRWLKWKILKIVTAPNADEAVEKLDLSHIAGRNVNGTASLKTIAADS